LLEIDREWRGGEGRGEERRNGRGEKRRNGRGEKRRNGRGTFDTLSNLDSLYFLL
jgi:hypothetical protein